MHPPTYRLERELYNGVGPSSEQVRRALDIAKSRSNLLPCDEQRNLDFDLAVRPLLDEIEACSHIIENPDNYVTIFSGFSNRHSPKHINPIKEKVYTAEDLSVRVT